MFKFRQNPKCADAEAIKQAIRNNGGYCPCGVEKDEDTKCPCKAFREQGEGVCGCGLWEAVNECNE